MNFCSKEGFRCDGQRCATCPEHGAEVATAPQAPETGTDRRRAILREVEACVCRDRQNTYSDAEENFKDIAGMASIGLSDILKGPMQDHHVALFCAIIKIARAKTSPNHLDNWVDLAGYGVCGAGIVKSRVA